jgi:hypothetical protein
MAATGAVLSLVLEFDIDSVPPAIRQLALEHLRDVLALRCTNRRPLGDIEMRVDLFLARSGRGYFALRSFNAEVSGRFFMGFLRAILADFVGPEPIMRFPPLQSEFRETEAQARDAEEQARLRIVSAQARGVLVSVENDSDIASDEEPGSDMSLGAVTSSTEIPWGGYESSSPPQSTEVSIENHADIADLADLADLEGCLDDADVA